MKSRARFYVLSVVVGLFGACSKGGSDAKDAEDADGRTAFDEKGGQHPCPPPRTDCESTEDASLAFQDRCQLAGHRIQICGCKELCTGSIAGAKHGYTPQNKKKDCATPKDDCGEFAETSAAFQDGCSEAGFQLIECGCEWLCSGKLKEALPEPTPEPTEGEGDGKDGDKEGGDEAGGDKKADKKKGKKEE